MKLISNTERSKIALKSICILIVFEVISLLSAYMQYSLLMMDVYGYGISDEQAYMNNRREQVIAYIYLFVYILAGICFLGWFGRAYYNLHSKLSHLKYNKIWAALGWFIPIIGFFRPYQVMKELYLETQTYLNKNRFSFNCKVTKVDFYIWWSLWIITLILNNSIDKYDDKISNNQELLKYTLFFMLNNVLSIILWLYFLKLIKGYSSLEESLLEIENVDHHA